MKLQNDEKFHQISVVFSVQRSACVLLGSKLPGIDSKGDKSVVRLPVQEHLQNLKHAKLVRCFIELRYFSEAIMKIDRRRPDRQTPRYVLEGD